MIPVWGIPIIVDAVVYVLALLIATHYYRFYHRDCQLDEPFTRIFSRIAEAFPYVWWPLQAGLLAYSLLTMIFAEWYWKPIGYLGYGFMFWWIPHILNYIQTNGPNNPPNQLKERLKWLLK